MRILLIDTCTEKGVIAYENSNEILFTKGLPAGRSQSKYLIPYLEEALRPYGHPFAVDAIAVGIGPGSYTGIRMGVAAAQTLAYCWKIPLIGISSLVGFIPSIKEIEYAALIDARIGGVYFQIGRIEKEGTITRSAPQVSSIEEASTLLKNISYFVTPFAKNLEEKFQTLKGEKNRIWQELNPSVEALLQYAKDSFIDKKFIYPPSHLELLYLRETEAERNLKISKNQSNALKG